MLHQSSKQILLGTFVALMLITMPAYAVKNYRISNYGDAHQVWFEAEDFDERIPPTDECFPVVDKAGAFGQAVSRSGSGGRISWTFDISKSGGKGGTWYFWARLINPDNQSDYMLVKGDPGDAEIPSSPPFPSGDGAAPFTNADDRIFEENVGTEPDNWAWSGSGHGGGYTKELQNGQNTMYIFDRQGSPSISWDVFMWTDSPDYVPTDEDYVNAVIPAAGPATNPGPANEATDVPRDVTLSWTPGEFAPPTNGHTVYFSESFDDVNAGIDGITQDANSYAVPQRLGFGKTYYWRIDEVNGPPDFMVYKGEVWQFTVEPFAYPIAGTSITATASSQFNENTRPESTINGAGLDENDLHSIEETGIWVSSMTGPQPTWIQYEFDGVYKLLEMWVWNYNTSIEPVLGFGFKDATIEYSSDGANWATLGTTHEFARAPGTAGYAHNTTIDLSGVVAKYVKITANSNWGGVLPQYGLSEVRFFYVPVLPKEPNPASGTIDVPVAMIGQTIDVILSFIAGREAASHNVYLSTDEQAVIDGTAPVTTVTEASYGPLTLDLDQTYYWRVDEVNEAETPTTWQGDVWNFSTQKYLVVDDIEDYNDFEPDRIFDTWIDGWGVPENGSQIGYDMPPFAEQAIVHSGSQSMPLHYDNTAGVAYSEAERTFATPQDWTFKGAKALTLWFKGNPIAFQESPPGTFTISADGEDIYGSADEFRYVWKQLSGDGSIIATVESVLWVPGSDDWSKAGLMIRETLDAGSSNAFVAITTGAGDGATFQWRPTTGGTSSSRTLVGISPPAAVKLVRQGSIFTGYVFLDGQWQQEGQSATIPMQDPVYIGLALTSHNAGETTVAKFSDISTTGAVMGQWQVADIGVDQPSNTASPLYVAVEDSTGKSAEVKYPDAAATTINTWIPWSIDLAEFTGVNPRSIKKMIIGVGDKANPQPASGLVYIDDIQLYRSAPAYTVRIGSSNHDAEEHVSDGSIDLTSSDLELAYEDAGEPATDEQIICLRFVNVSLPKRAQVTSAYVEFEVDETKGGTAPVNLIIEGELTPDAASLAASNFNISQRLPSTTTAKVNWSIPPWTKVDEKFQTPDISSIIQEIVNQEGWTRGNALVLIFRDDKDNPSTGIRCAESYDGEATAAPTLYVTY